MQGREYTEDELQFIGREIADYVINNYDRGLIPHADEIVNFMQKNYGVPPEFTNEVLALLFPNINNRIVILFWTK